MPEYREKDKWDSRGAVPLFRPAGLKAAPEGQPLRIGLDFSSDDEEVAVVDGSGMVSAVAPGTCTISVWEYESDTTVTYTVTVTDEVPETSAQETEQAATTQAPESSAEQAQTEAPSGDGTDASTEPEGSGQAAPESSASGESAEKDGGSSPLVIWISVILGVGAAALLVYFRKKR